LSANEPTTHASMMTRKRRKKTEYKAPYLQMGC